MTINERGPECVSPETWEELYESVIDLMAHIGAYGAIDSKEQWQLCERVRDALFDIDDGDYRPKKPNAK